MDKTALQKISYGLYVLTTHLEEKDNGCVINTLLQITSKEPSVCLISVNKANYTHDMIMQSKVFNVSCLSTNAPFDIFKNFGFQSGKNVDKFADVTYAKRSANGIYYIDEYSNAFLSFKVINVIDCDTHSIFVAEMTDGEVLSQQESLTYAYYHKNVKPQPQAAPKTEGGKWQCRICGYIHEGDSLPEDIICPLCKHGAADFVKI